MSQFLRILLLIIIFLFLYRLLRKFLFNLFNSSGRDGNKSGFRQRKKKYENVEEAKFIDISDEDKKEKNP